MWNMIKMAKPPEYIETAKTSNYNKIAEKFVNYKRLKICLTQFLRDVGF